MAVDTNSPDTSAREKRSRSIRGDILFAFAVAVVLTVAWFMRDVLLLLYVSALFAVVFRPLIRGTMRIRVGSKSPGRGVAIFLLLAAFASGTVLFFAFAMPPVIRDFSQFTKELPWRGPMMLDRLKTLPFSSHIDVATLNTKIQGFASNFAEYLLLSISDWASKVADIAAAIVLMIYFMLEGDLAYRWVLSFFPTEIRERLDDTLIRAEGRIGKWLLGQASLMLILGVTSTIVFVLLKIRYAYALGVIMGVLNIIPVIGAMASMALVLVAAAMDSWEKVLGALIFYAIYAQIETSFLTPRIMQSSVGLPGLAVLVALLLGSKLAGIVGAMVAVPTAVLVAVLLHEYLRKEDAVT